MMLGYFLDLDRRGLLFVNGLSGNASLDLLMKILSSSELWFGVGGVILGVGIVRRNATMVTHFVGALIALGLADLISFEVIKPWVARERPCWTVDGVQRVLGYCGGSYGFTSNHAANAAALVTFLMLSRRFSRKQAVFAWMLALGVGTSRIYLGVHYPFDILGGFMLGVLVAHVLIKLNILAAITVLMRRLLRPKT